MRTMPLLLVFILFFNLFLGLLSNPCSFNRLEIVPQIIIVVSVVIIIVVVG